VTQIFRGYAESELGQLHYCESGSGSPILLLHQTPRSMDEFTELIPLLARHHRVIAMDMIGFGLSPTVAEPHSIELMADGAEALLNSLGIEDATILGHHTGGAVAIELGARTPSRASRLVLSSAPWTDMKFRSTHAHGSNVDDATIVEDGSHLIELWSFRAPYYPKQRPDLLNRFIRDALAPGVDPAQGHLACARYEMETKINKIDVPVLLIGADSDPFALPDLEPLRTALNRAPKIDTVVISNGHIPLMEEHPEQVAAAVLEFLNLS
jgi:pimeloyl-ACP methyl ester carboxylesterase